MKIIEKNTLDFRKIKINDFNTMPWGTHLCQFYQTKKDLLEILIPYFKAGLKNNEFCIWVTSEPLSAKEAKNVLKKEVKNLDKLIKKGQLEILDHSQWYTKGGKFNANKMLAAWIEKERHALRRGFSGLRLTGNTFWLEKKDWKNFTEYEEKVNNAIGKLRMLALCTYSLDKCKASQVIDVVNNHQLSLIKREGKWVSVESSSYRKAADNLKEINLKYELLIDNIPLHIAATDRTGKFIVWNKHSEELFYYKKKESIGKLEPKDLHTSIADAKKVIRAAKEKGIFDGDIKLKRKDSSLVDTHLVVIPHRDERGVIVNYYGFGEDITERKQAEEKIVNLAKFPSENPSPVLRIAKDGKILFANEASQLFISKWPSAPGHYVPYFIKRSITDTIRSGKKKEIEIEDKDRTIVFSLKPVKEGGYVNMYGLDITERKRAEKLLQGSHHEMEKRVQERTRELKESNKAIEIIKDALNRAQTVAHIGSWNLNTIKNVLTWSDETYRIFGLEIGSPLDYEKFLKIVHPDDREYVSKSWQYALQKGLYKIEHRIIVDGSVKWVREIAQVELDKKGKAISGIGTVQDITEYKQQEESLRKLQEELTHVSRVTTMGELTAALAHELNQPLMAIISNAQAAQRFMAKENPDLNEIKDILADIIRDDKRASDVINKLKGLLKKSELEFTALNINDVIREVLSLIPSNIVINNISLNTHLDENISFVDGDRIQLQQVILNLILNSFEAMKDAYSKTLCIRTAREDNGSIIVSIEDSGTGIDEKSITRLFEPFFTTKKEGMGMGLAINKAIINSHGGSLWAKNNKDKGASFYFTLPINKRRSE
ncbi:MAG: hypothetical protein A2447_03150 [Omnitrophica WOR_2 bacterium RIFOXYC2_FULL_38_12]|nr:MAG: hypothetical protein A2447_03150 [Omnitrophica WOR_2 bacterium RIFOXYC2_FULL_38_12]